MQCNIQPTVVIAERIEAHKAAILAQLCGEIEESTSGAAPGECAELAEELLDLMVARLKASTDRSPGALAGATDGGRGDAREWRRISRDLHDRVGHEISVASRQLELAEIGHARGTDGFPVHVKEAKAALLRAHQEIRDVISDLRVHAHWPGMEQALVRLMTTIVDPRLEHRITLIGDVEGLPPRIRDELFLILREAITNSISHAGADLLEVCVKIAHDRITAIVRDNGRGFSGWRAKQGNGLTSMRERGVALGGLVTIESTPGKGTEVVFRAPVRPVRDERPKETSDAKRRQH
ncbi:sensor histidine kinase [Nonomuraea sp. NPDC050227]|uniref:sensor histidine kinase n=1 Tax=Nonomuraea sp. NPDC050227 TaxID=3364360 RepID=UPI0037B1948D